MKPEYEKFIPALIELHKKEQGGRLDWSSLRLSLPDLPKGERDGVRLKMIEMGVIKAHPADSTGYTMLVIHDFDLNDYKRKVKQKEDKEDIDYKLVKQQLEDYPKVKKQAKDAITISIVAIVVAVILAVIGWIVQ